MPDFNDVAHFLRWRLIPLRYSGRLATLVGARSHIPRSATVEQVLQNGHGAGHTLTDEVVRDVNDIYRSRIAAVVPTTGGHPFVNLFTAADIAPENPVFRLAFSPEVLDTAVDYFNGNLILDSIQALYSWPTSGELRESQMWHKDYGDSKSFHWIAYMNDILGPDDGPFGYVNRHDARRIRRSIFIRRVSDQQFSRELGSGRQLEFLGRAGMSLFIDPAVCYHYGSRCRNGRFALFVTFNTDRPFVRPVPLVRENRSSILRAAIAVRPDLNARFLKRMLQIGS